MKIAIIAQPWKKLPTNEYSGIETVICGLSEQLIGLGEEVILFAPAGSTSTAKIIEYPETISGFNFNNIDEKQKLYLKNLISKYAESKAVALGVDIIHNFTLTGELDNSIPTIYTVFGPPEDSILINCKSISKYALNYLVAVSDRQIDLFNDIAPEIKFIDTIHKSININKIEWDSVKEDYFLFFGHPQEGQGLSLARRVTEAADKRLVAVIQGEKQSVFQNEIGPWLNNKSRDVIFKFMEDVTPEARYELYRKAKATFYVSHWEEPFGIEMLESMACGTPVIALNIGAADEVIEDGKTGFVVETETEMIDAVNKIDSIKPEVCRKTCEDKFSEDFMTKKYLSLYKKVLTLKV